MFKNFMYVLVEQEFQYMRTNTVLICVSKSREDLEELILSLWQECAYEVFCKHYMRGEYDFVSAKEYADRVAQSYANTLMIVKVPEWI